MKRNRLTLSCAESKISTAGTYNECRTGRSVTTETGASTDDLKSDLFIIGTKIYKLMYHVNIILSNTEKCPHREHLI